jgi:hypothetical protein
MIARGVSIALGIALVACTGSVEPVTSADLAEADNICPVREPEVDVECVDSEETTDPLDSTATGCEYGANADLACERFYGCMTATSTWIRNSPPGALDCALNHCPAARSDIQEGAQCPAPFGATTAPREYVCGYAEGTCGCVQNSTGYTWTCVPPPKSPCPPTRPRLGQQCDHDNLTCDYGACAFEHSAAVVCAAKRWQLAAPTCDKT